MLWLPSACGQANRHCPFCNYALHLDGLSIRCGLFCVSVCKQMDTVLLLFLASVSSEKNMLPVNPRSNISQNEGFEKSKSNHKTRASKYPLKPGSLPRNQVPFQCQRSQLTLSKYPSRVPKQGLQNIHLGTKSGS